MKKYMAQKSACARFSGGGIGGEPGARENTPGIPPKPAVSILIGRC